MVNLDHLAKKAFLDNPEAKALLASQVILVVMVIQGQLVIQAALEQADFLARLEEQYVLRHKNKVKVGFVFTKFPFFRVKWDEGASLELKEARYVSTWQNLSCTYISL